MPPATPPDPRSGQLSRWSPVSVDAPLVSIGLPTYNGERYIREALDSLLAQDYPNLEILISDNASTDGTWEIVQGYAHRDGRVRVVRQERNIGAMANFNFVFLQSAGPFFMWAADDDRWEPSYVSACLRALQATTAAVLACTKIRFINEGGESIESATSRHDNPDLSSPSTGQRIRLLLSRDAWYQLYGLTRRESLARTRLGTNAYGADVVLLVELALQGPFVLVPEVLFHYRLFESRTEPDRGAWHNAIENRSRVRAAPYSHLQEAVSQAIALSALRWTDRAHGWLGMFVAAYVKPTLLRSLIAAEARVRLRMAIRDRNVRSIAKYAWLGALIAMHRRLRDRRRAVP
jgi:glycosyltransferase involved in cell wall biosynthesis